MLVGEGTQDRAHDGRSSQHVPQTPAAFPFGAAAFWRAVLQANGSATGCRWTRKFSGSRNCLIHWNIQGLALEGGNHMLSCRGGWPEDTCLFHSSLVIAAPIKTAPSGVTAQTCAPTRGLPRKALGTFLSSSPCRRFPSNELH